MSLDKVARRAKVSTATVSRVLNNASVAKSSTRARVMKAIAELKYHTNLQRTKFGRGKEPHHRRDRFQHGESVFLRHLQDG
jgi:LacI family transcriptional regulator